MSSTGTLFNIILTCPEFSLAPICNRGQEIVRHGLQIRASAVNTPHPP
jgi:hypothetical protein